jgi:hypothetical protein
VLAQQNTLVSEYLTHIPAPHFTSLHIVPSSCMPTAVRLAVPAVEGHIAVMAGQVPIFHVERYAATPMPHLIPSGWGAHKLIDHIPDPDRATAVRYLFTSSPHCPHVFTWIHSYANPPHPSLHFASSARGFGNRLLQAQFLSQACADLYLFTSHSKHSPNTYIHSVPACPGHSPTHTPPTYNTLSNRHHGWLGTQEDA